MTYVTAEGCVSLLSLPECLSGALRLRFGDKSKSLATAAGLLSATGMPTACGTVSRDTSSPAPPSGASSSREKSPSWAQVEDHFVSPVRHFNVTDPESARHVACELVRTLGGLPDGLLGPRKDEAIGFLPVTTRQPIW